MSIIQRIKLFLFLFVALLGSSIALFWVIWAIIFAPNGDRAIQIIIAMDRLFNAATGGNGKETLSSRSGRLQKENVKWACVLCNFLDKLEKDHCNKSIGV
jgi:hypothetical protein